MRSAFLKISYGLSFQLALFTKGSRYVNAAEVNQLAPIANQSAVSTVIGRHLKIERTQELKNPKPFQNYFQDVLV